MSRGKLIIIVAPSGTGKTTLIKRLKLELPQLEESVSYTTRPQRDGEVNGSSYFFVDIEVFEKRKKSGDFLESACVHSNYYGTSKSFVDEKLNSGSNLLFDLDVQGCDSMKSHYAEEAKVIFIEPPSCRVLEERLLGRATDTAEVINERVENARRELKRKNDFDYLVMNDVLDDCYDKLKVIFLKILNE